MSDPGHNEARRRFLKDLSRGLGGATLTAAGAAPLLGCGSAEEGKPRASQQRAPQQDRREAPSLGVALVGLGNYSTGQLAPALQETERCHLAGVVTGTPAKADDWKSKYDLPEQSVYNYDTFDQIAADDRIDIVYVVLPNAMHAEYTIRAAEAGKHVICEKPMAVSVQECEDMIAACREAGSKLSIGYRLHFEPHHQRVMALGQEEKFGPVQAMENTDGFPLGPASNPSVAWRLDHSLAGGGALMDVGIYALQAARYTTGEEPTSVRARAFKTQPEKFSEVDENVVWEMDFPSGAAAQCRTSYTGSFNRLHAEAPEGWFELEPAYSYGGLEGRTSEGPMNIENVNQQAAQMDAFAECIQTGRRSRVPGEEGLRDLRVIEAIYEAVETGGTVEVA
jgi:predicted dehydrogenase